MKIEYFFKQSAASGFRLLLYSGQCIRLGYNDSKLAGDAGKEYTCFGSFKVSSMFSCDAHIHFEVVHCLLYRSFYFYRENFIRQNCAGYLETCGTLYSRRCK